MGRLLAILERYGFRSEQFQTALRDRLKEIGVDLTIPPKLLRRWKQEDEEARRYRERGY
jgi:hypothetical protein